MFLALRSEDINEPFFLSPQVMRCSDQIWLVNLSPTLSYWKSQLCHPQRSKSAPGGLDIASRCPGAAYAAGHDLALPEIFAMVLKNMDPHFSAALSEHPWSALLLLHHMCQRKLMGLLSYFESFGKAQYLEISWETWFETADLVFGKNVTASPSQKCGSGHLAQAYGIFL